MEEKENKNIKNDQKEKKKYKCFKCGNWYNDGEECRFCKLNSLPKKSMFKNNKEKVVICLTAAIGLVLILIGVPLLILENLKEKICDEGYTKINNQCVQCSYGYYLDLDTGECLPINDKTNDFQDNIDENIPDENQLNTQNNTDKENSNNNEHDYQTQNNNTQSNNTQSNNTQNNNPNQNNNQGQIINNNQTISQRNALKTAMSYLNSSSFSYKGLIEQLEYEKFTNSQATYAVNNCGADWNEQAAKSAASYLKSSSFSREELINQLEFEGFTHEQAIYGVTANGY